MSEIWERTRIARDALGIDAKEMPGKFKELDIEITADAYYKYEKRSPLRQDLIAPFCKITGVRMEWLLSGTPPMKIDEYSQSAADVINQYVEGFEEDESLIAAKEAFLINLKRVREEKK